MRLWSLFSEGASRVRLGNLAADFEQDTFELFAYLGRYCGQQMRFVTDMTRREAALLARATSKLIGGEKSTEMDPAGGRR